MKNILITGAAGELGRSLLTKLIEYARTTNIQTIICLDLQPQPPGTNDSSIEWIQGSVLDTALIDSLFRKYKFDTCFHFAALLSAAAAKNPSLSRQVNIESSKLLIQRSISEITENKQTFKFIFPSSIAVYGLDKNQRDIAIDESFLETPLTSYGKQKLEIERFGSQISTEEPLLDFRCLRFPGLICADTIPVGGTSDYASLIAHAAARSEPYSCYVSPETTLSFMAMPDAVSALLTLATIAREDLSKKVYNLHGFTISALQIAELTKSNFPQAQTSFAPSADRQVIVDSWPALTDCTAFCSDLKWKPQHNQQTAFTEYLFPRLRQLYKTFSKTAGNL